MKLRLYGTLKESITDGPGIRYAIFTQGCPHNCPGCHNPDSHAFSDGFWRDTDDLLAEILANPLLDGVTFSGGEPFMQAEELAAMAGPIKAAGLNLIIFTGYTWEELHEQAPHRPGWQALLHQADILIDGRFEPGQRSLNLRFRGSANQRAINVQASLAAGQVVPWPL
jgi:anaerobic ribonucleoside-triphosphate reductase activating protein